MSDAPPKSSISGRSTRKIGESARRRGSGAETHSGAAESGGCDTALTYPVYSYTFVIFSINIAL